MMIATQSMEMDVMPTVRPGTTTAAPLLLPTRTRSPIFAPAPVQVVTSLFLPATLVLLASTPVVHARTPPTA